MMADSQTKGRADGCARGKSSQACSSILIDVLSFEVDNDVVIKVALSSVSRSASEPDPAAAKAGARPTLGRSKTADDDAVDLTDEDGADAVESTEPKGK